MSNKREREKRREERIAAESQAGNQDRRKKLLQFGAGAVFLAVVVVVALIVVASSGDDGGDSTNIKEADVVNRELSGIPQNGTVLGDPNAPVELVEFGDLQCPVCKAYSEEVLPQVIEKQVKTGKAKIDFRNFTIISAESVPAGAAALAAGEQGRGWNYIDTFYRNQGKEATGYAEDEFFTAVAKAAGVKDIAQWNKDRNSAKIKNEVKQTTAEAQRLGLTGTPSYAIKGPSTEGLEPLPETTSSGDLEAAIAAAS